MKGKRMNRAAVLLALAVIFCQSRAYALENVTVPTENKEMISVELPVVEERDPFSFFIDPLHILYHTFDSSGGDITVEEDTCLLFYNRDESDYTLSSRSDRLEIVNKSTVPVEVTITAKLENAGEIFVRQDKAFEDRDSCDLYLALVDNEGNEQPLSADGEVSVKVTLERAPLDAYAYVLCEDTEEYRYVSQAEEVDFDTYSFGLTGACNEGGDWADISGRPHVTISWNVEPVVSEEVETEEESEESLEDVSESSASEEDVPETEEADMSETGTEEPGRSEPGTDESSAAETGASGPDAEDPSAEKPDTGASSAGKPDTEEPGTGKPTAVGEEDPLESAAADTEGSAS